MQLIQALALAAAMVQTVSAHCELHYSPTLIPRAKNLY